MEKESQQNFSGTSLEALGNGSEDTFEPPESVSVPSEADFRLTYDLSVTVDEDKDAPAEDEPYDNDKQNRVRAMTTLSDESGTKITFDQEPYTFSRPDLHKFRGNVNRVTSGGSNRFTRYSVTIGIEVIGERVTAYVDGSEVLATSLTDDLGGEIQLRYRLRQGGAKLGDNNQNAFATWSNVTLEILEDMGGDVTARIADTGGETNGSVGVIETDRSHEEFYSWDSGSNTVSASGDIPRSADTATVCIHKAGDGTYALGLVYTEQGTGQGDGVESFVSAPGEFIVKDDTERFPGDEYDDPRANNRWSSRNTDGYMYGTFSRDEIDGVSLTISDWDSIDVSEIRVVGDDGEISRSIEKGSTVTFGLSPSVTATASTMQWIPGQNENESQGGFPLDGSLMQVFREDDSYTYSFGSIPGVPGDLVERELEIDPVLDAWLKGDQTDVDEEFREVRPGNDELPVNIEEARQKEPGKYADEFGRFEEFGIFRVENGIEVSFETPDGETVERDTVEIEFNESAPEPELNPEISLRGDENPVTVTPDSDVNGIPVDDWHDGNLEERSYRDTRWYSFDPEFEFDGVEGVRVSTISGGLAGFVPDWTVRMLDNSAEFFSEVWGWGLEGYLAETAWSLLDVGPVGPSTITELLVAAPRSYTFLDFIVLADGRRYVRVWDASPYPSLALYVDGLRRQQDKMSYNPRERLNGSNMAFFGWSAGGLTPYQGSLLEYQEITRALAEGETPEQVDDLLEDLARRVRFSVSDLAKEVPRMTAAFDAEGEPLEDADAPFEDDFFTPFFNALVPDRAIQDSVDENI